MALKVMRAYVISRSQNDKLYDKNYDRIKKCTEISLIAQTFKLKRMFQKVESSIAEA